MEQPQVELIVRVTARVSAAVFAAALILFAAGTRSRASVRHEIRLFAVFILAQTIHFSAVMWLAVLTAGGNIRTRGGWVVVLPVAVLFYLAAFAILRAWHNLGAGRLLSRSERLAAHAGVAFIALVFLNSYIARVGRMSLYWVPAILMFAAVVTYFTQVHLATSAVRSSNASPSS